MDELVVDARSGQDHIAAIVVPNPHVALSAAELLAVLNERIAVASLSLESCENIRGLVVVSSVDFATWKTTGLLTSLGKYVRGAIAKHYRSELDALYGPVEFQFADQCHSLMNSQGVRERLLGTIAFMLQVDPTIVEQHDGHLGSLGLSSLGAAQLSATLKQARFNSRAVSSALLVNMDLEGLVECVRSGVAVLHAQDALLKQMEMDSHITDGLRKTIAEQAPKETLHSVLVTGGTGVLGAAIIADILSNALSTVEHVLCLVRADSVARGRERLLVPICAALGVESLPERLATRLAPVLGRLEQDRLGMGEGAFKQLARRVDCIIHCAAVVNHVLPYSGHSEANVGGTRRLLELAVVGGTNSAFHFVSTSTVVLASKPSAPILESTPLRMSAAACNLNGYAQSKLVSELLCVDAAVSGRLPVAIYRPGIISSHRDTGFCKREDFYPRLLQAMASHRICPTVHEDATFDMSPLEWVSRGVTHIALKQTAAQMVRSGEGVFERVFHTIAKASHEVPFQTLVDGVRAHGIAVTQVAYTAFEQVMEDVAEFAPLLHELRPAGRCSTRWLDTSVFERAVSDASPPMPPSGVSAEVVAASLAFLADDTTGTKTYSQVVAKAVGSMGPK